MKTTLAQTNRIKRGCLIPTPKTTSSMFYWAKGGKHVYVDSGGEIHEYELPTPFLLDDAVFTRVIDK